MSEALPPIDSAAPSQKRNKRPRKEKKQAIHISLWVNKTAYEYGLLCTFCTKNPAICHCPACSDFYCEICDITAHNTKKRRDHIRTVLSKLDLNAAAHIVTRAVRRYGHLRLIQDMCRKKFLRKFDTKTLNYFYVNTVYGTVSWRKPYCLRELELFPYMTPAYAACKCQNLYYIWKAREKVRNALMTQYKKIFDRKNGRFYYAFNGKSRLLPKSSWKKPYFLGKRSFPKDLSPIFTIDSAAVVIQRKWRTILMWQFLRALARACYDEIWDPVYGRYNYFHRDSEQLFQTKPRLFRNEPWDPNRVPEWSMSRVSLFMRRIGLKQYVDTMLHYEVDGNALLLLDQEDYENMAIVNKLHIKKIRVELDKIYTPARKLAMSEEHFARREKIRRNKMFLAAALLIQRQFRKYAARKTTSMMKEIKRIKLAEEALNQQIAAAGFWWSQNKTLVSLRSDQTLQDVGGNKLPAIVMKDFGRYREYMSASGWTRRNNVTGEMLTDKTTSKIQHPSIYYTEKLRINGYDQRRMQEMEATIL